MMTQGSHFQLHDDDNTMTIVFETYMNITVIITYKCQSGV